MISSDNTPTSMSRNKSNLEETWQLSKYDEARTAAPILPGETKVTLQWADISNEFKCPVCLDLLTNTRLTEVGGVSALP